MPVFESRVSLPATPEAVFEFICKPANLQKIGPPEAGVVFTMAPDVISLGSRLEVKVQSYGTVQKMTYEITQFDAPKQYREIMVQGPLKSWVHDYIVEPATGGHADLVNRIEFEPPPGILGLMITADKLLDSLEDGFDYRRKALLKIFK